MRYIRIIRNLACCMIIPALAGCETLPPGNPPEGPIVAGQSGIEKPLSRDAAVNWMITSLSAACLQNIKSGVAMRKEFAGRAGIAQAYPEKVFSRVAAITGIVSGDDTAEFRLNSVMIRRSANIEWQMGLFSGKKLIWHESVCFE